MRVIGSEEFKDFFRDKKIFIFSIIIQYLLLPVTIAYVSSEKALTENVINVKPDFINL